jgi:glycosyl transferase family 87
MLSQSVRNRLAFFLAGMVLLHVTFFYGQWHYIRAGLPDFTIFYTAGKIIGSGQGASLYDDDVQRAIEKQFLITVALGGTILPYNHPPFEAGFFVPFAHLPYSAAYLLWLAINMGLAVSCVALLRRHLDDFRTLPLWFFALAVFAFPPLFIALMQGQDVIWLLFCYGMTYALLRRGSEFAAGGWLALGLCKFHLILPFLFAFVWQKRMKVIMGFALVATALVLVGFAFVGVRESFQYPCYVWKTDHTPIYRWAVDHHFNPNIRAVIVNTLGSEGHRANWIVLAVSVFLLTASAATWERLRRWGDVGWRLGFGLNLFTTLLVSYHTWVQDMSLLFLPIIVALDVLAFKEPNARTVRLTLLSSAAILFFSPLYLLLILRFNQFFLITFVLLAFMAGMIGLAYDVRTRAKCSAEHEPVLG